MALNLSPLITYCMALGNFIPLCTHGSSVYHVEYTSAYLLPVLGDDHQREVKVPSQSKCPIGAPFHSWGRGKAQGHMVWSATRPPLVGETPALA